MPGIRYILLPLEGMVTGSSDMTTSTGTVHPPDNTYTSLRRSLGFYSSCQSSFPLVRFAGETLQWRRRRRLSHSRALRGGSSLHRNRCSASPLPENRRMSTARGARRISWDTTEHFSAASTTHIHVDASSVFAEEGLESHGPGAKPQVIACRRARAVVSRQCLPADHRPGLYAVIACRTRSPAPLFLPRPAGGYACSTTS